MRGSMCAGQCVCGAVCVRGSVRESIRIVEIVRTLYKARSVPSVTVCSDEDPPVHVEHTNEQPYTTKSRSLYYQVKVLILVSQGLVLVIQGLVLVSQGRVLVSQGLTKAIVLHRRQCTLGSERLDLVQ